MCSDAKQAAAYCAMFSATGIFFMSFVGFLLMTQPLYILGIDDVEDAKGRAFGAAGAYFFCFVVSIVYAIREARMSYQVQTYQYRRTLSNHSFGGASSTGSYDDLGIFT